MCFVGCRPELPPPPPEPDVLEVRLLETAPPSPARVGTAARLSARVGYRSDLPVRFSATPLLRGEPVRAGSNGSPAWPAGEGEALVWFFLFEPGLVDGLRIGVGHANGRGTFRSFDFPLDAEFVGGSGPASREVAWVARLESTAEALRAAQRPAADPGGAADTALGVAIIGGLFGVLILAAALPIAGIRSWTGHWRWGAWLALAIFAVPSMNVVIGVMIDPTSHNLWPLELFGYAVASVSLCSALFVLRKLRGDA
jgi:hypothetical protein